MHTIKKYLTALRKLVPAYLRPDRTPEGEEQQKIASATTHG